MADFTHILGVLLPTIEIHHRATLLPQYAEVYAPHEPYKKNLEGWEKQHNPDKNNKSTSRNNRGNGVNQEENLQDSQRKSKKRIRNLAKNNQFQLWVTLTMKSDRQNDEKTFRKLQTWIKSEIRRVGKFDYLIVPERHKDGALHFHCLFGNYNGTLTPRPNIKNPDKPYMRGNRQIFNLATYTHGWTDVEYIESPERIAAYITKYITKDMPTLGLNKKRYWASRSLKYPETQENPEWFDPLTHGNMTRHVTEHGTLYKIPYSAIPQQYHPITSKTYNTHVRSNTDSESA